MTTVLLILHLMIASSLVAVVLLQRSEGGALGIGGGGGFMSGRGAANFLTRVTAGLAGAFFLTSLALTLLATRPAGPRSILDTPLSLPAKSQPSDKGQPAAPGGAPGAPAQPRGGVLDKLGPPPPSGPQVPRSQ